MQRFFLLLWALILPLQSFAIMRTDAFQENDIPDNLWVCSVFQNEGPYLREWIEYHRMIGAEHFILFNNNSDDDYLNILDPYIQDKVVTLVEWPTPRHQASYNQTGAIRQALNMSRGKTRWLASIDIDEFIVPMYTENLVDFLRS
ncbi:MAG: glycosyltransferase family 92 protein, partial [Chlamydiia bacterium]|nr:glycosyltransferase family 92 protein [Chlamydiia bacterium]